MAVVPVPGQEGRDILRPPALGAEDGVAPAPRRSGEVPQEGIVGGLHALGTRDLRAEDAKAPVGPVCLLGAGREDLPEEFADVAGAAAEGAVCDACQSGAGRGVRRRRVEPDACRGAGGSVLPAERGDVLVDGRRGVRGPSSVLLGALAP